MHAAPTNFDLLEVTLNAWADLEAHRKVSGQQVEHAKGAKVNGINGTSSSSTVKIQGTTLSLGHLVAVSRYGAVPELDESAEVVQRVQASVDCVNKKLENGESLYGINTGFGGSADTRTTHTRALQVSLVSGMHIGILETNNPATGVLGISDEPLSQPEAWVRGAMVVRLNSLIRGHSGVRFSVLRALQSLLKHNIIPVVPVRSSISASGDLSPLSYIAGALSGMPGVYVWIDGPQGGRVKVSAPKALAKAGLEPITLEPKEGLGLLNGTAFSAAVVGNVMHDANMLAFMSQCLTALACEADLASDGSFAPFIHNECRPHPGQIECGATILSLLQGSKLATHLEDEHAITIDEDDGKLRQDRYPYRTSPQWIGPQLEDLLASTKTVLVEIASTTDNPLISASENVAYHGGNFQALAPCAASEKTRVNLAHLGKVIFQQMSELINPAMSRGLPANLAAGPLSLDFHCKPIDIALASALSELLSLANPVSTHVQSCELGNQSVYSLALVSARRTIQAVDVLSQLFSWSLYLVCQALDLRALQLQVAAALKTQLEASIRKFFGEWITSDADQKKLGKRIFERINKRMDETSAQVIESRLVEAFAHGGYELIAYFSELPSGGGADPLRNIMAWRNYSAAQTEKLYHDVTAEYLASPNKCHAGDLLGKTKPLYTYVRTTLGVPMAGRECFYMFEGEQGKLGDTVGSQVSKIYESIRNGNLYAVLAGMGREIINSA